MTKVDKKERFDVVIVGAGISGLTLAERYALIGKRVLVVESRNHIGGNCYDYHDKCGLLVAKYGPHYFRTNDEGVWDYVKKFSEWKKFEAKVVAHVDGKKVSIPININTINQVFGIKIRGEDEMSRWLEENRLRIANPKNAEEAALSRVGPVLYKKIFKEYTQKQWGKDPKELSREITDRIPVRTNFDDRYFEEKYQAIPVMGYTALFEKMIESNNIKVILNKNWNELKNQVEYSEKLFFTGRIDLYFNEKFGSLEYRSIRFELETYNRENYQDYVQENFPSIEVPYTRIVEYKRMTGQKHPMTTISKEFPTWDGDPYYPVASEKNKKTYSEYQNASKELERSGIYFAGRLANYKYFNMDQAFRNSLDLFDKLENKSLS